MRVGDSLVNQKDTAIAPLSDTKAKTALKEEQERSTKNGKQYFVDATEIGIERPQDFDKQKDRYSGKHKKHTIKNTVITNEYSQILFLGNTYAGSVHDKKMLEQDEVLFPPNSFLWKDLGYVGYLPTNINCFEPHKKPKNKALSKEQKEENKLISSIRIVVEHAISGLKRCRILKDKMRTKIDKTKDTIIEICAGLHNLRLKFRKKYKCNELFNS